MNAWNTFTGGDWQNEINVRDFIQKNYTPYDGDGASLSFCFSAIRRSTPYSATRR